MYQSHTNKRLKYLQIKNSSFQKIKCKKNKITYFDSVPKYENSLDVTLDDDTLQNIYQSHTNRRLEYLQINLSSC